VKLQGEKLADYNRMQLEHEALENARQDRADKVEREYLHAQSLLVEATAGQEKAEKTLATLQETIGKLQQSNQDVNAQLLHYQDLSKQENQRLSDALLKAEKEAQHLRIQSETQDEDIKRMRLDKSASDKHIIELKGRITILEKNLNEATVMASATSRTCNTGEGVVSPDPNAVLEINHLVFDILPPFSSTKQKIPGPSVSDSASHSDKENMTKSNVRVGKLCAVCFKASTGIMKTCQCGRPSCNIRAHMSCINRINPGPSVSHPGTPAPRLPIVLCGHEIDTPSQLRTPLAPCLPSTVKKNRSDISKQGSQLNH
jgi:hypothetical protein